MSRADLVKRLSDEIYHCDPTLPPTQMPKVPYMAAEWFLAMIGKECSGVNAHAMLKRFLHQGREFQDLVIGAASEGVPWSGQHEFAFEKTIEAHKMIQKTGISDEIKDTAKKLTA